MLPRLDALVLLAALIGLASGVQAASGPLEGYESPVLLIPASEWPSDNVLEERAYFNGVLETYAFILYGYWPRTPRYEAEFSAFRRCIEGNPRPIWPLDWVWGESLKATAAAQLIRKYIPQVCRDYKGDGGGGGWQPPRIISKQNWQAFNSDEREFYVAAYIETATELMVLLDKGDDVVRMKRCMADGGLGKVLERLKQMQVDWQSPMPWTVSGAVGAVCNSR